MSVDNVLINFELIIENDKVVDPVPVVWVGWYVDFIVYVIYIYASPLKQFGKLLLAIAITYTHHMDFNFMAMSFIWIC